MRTNPMADKQPHDLLDETIHQRTRLAIMATLTGVESLDFAESWERAKEDGWRAVRVGDKLVHRCPECI